MVQSPNNFLAVLVVPFVLNAAFLFLPARATLCLRIVSSFFVLDATFYLIFKITRAHWSIKKEYPSQLSADHLMNQPHQTNRHNEAQIGDLKSLNLQ